MVVAAGLYAEPASAPSPSVGRVTLEEHAQRMQSLRQLLTACAADRAACQADRVGPDEQVQLNSGTVTRIRLQWLRAGITAIGRTTDEQRKLQAAQLNVRLDQLVLPASQAPAAQVRQAHEAFDQVLATAEFKQEQEITWLQRIWKRLVETVQRALLHGFQALGKAPGFVKYLFESLLFLVPAVLLLLWLFRQAREDRLRATAPASRPASGLAPRTEWLEQAGHFAQAGDWRQAIHALYWATIAGCEQRRVWQSNRTRTPREYLRLLEPGSALRQGLAEQTRLFELTWYGYREATTDDYRRAAELHSLMESQ